MEKQWPHCHSGPNFPSILTLYTHNLFSKIIEVNRQVYLVLVQNHTPLYTNLALERGNSVPTEECPTEETACLLKGGEILNKHQYNLLLDKNFVHQIRSRKGNYLQLTMPILPWQRENQYRTRALYFQTNQLFPHESKLI